LHSSPARERDDLRLFTPDILDPVQLEALQLSCLSALPLEARLLGLSAAQLETLEALDLVAVDTSGQVRAHDLLRATLLETMDETTRRARVKTLLTRLAAHPEPVRPELWLEGARQAAEQGDLEQVRQILEAQGAELLEHTEPLR